MKLRPLKLFFREGIIKSSAVWNIVTVQLRGQCLEGGNPVRQGANHTISSILVLVSVTVLAKRRKLGSRVIRQFSAEIRQILCADTVYRVEGNMCIFQNGEILHSTAVLEVSHVVQRHCVNWGEPIVSSSRVRKWYANQRKK